MQNENLSKLPENEAEGFDNDDRPVGRILSRREVLALFGAVGVGLLVGCGPTQSVSATSSNAAATPALNAEAQPVEAVNGVTAPACVVRPELTEGPYYVDEQLERSDIRSDPSDGSLREGASLQLTFNVSQVGGSGCTPLAGAIVDVWHCDALGVYSDVSDRSFDTSGQKFLRGSQVTDEKGVATFTTIYPGWYPGRTVHIHFKIRTNSRSGQSAEFTSQLFFDETLTDQVYAQQPYASRGQRNTLNSTDNIYDDQLLLTVTPTDQGYAATFDIWLQEV